MLAKMLGQDLVEKWPQKKVDYLRHTFLLFKRAYLRAGGDHLDITPADAMLVYLNVYNQDRLLDTPTDIVVNRLCKIWRELVIAGKSDEDKVDLVEAPQPNEKEGAPTKATSGVLNFFMSKTVYSTANPMRIAFIHEFPCARRAGTAYTTRAAGILMSTLAAPCAPSVRGLPRFGRVLRRRRDSRKARGERHLLDLTPAHGIHAQGVSRVSPGAVP